MKFRKHFDYDVTEASNEATIPASEYGESLTIQSMADECDLGTMLRRYANGGAAPPMAAKLPTYGDFSGVSDYRSALHVVMEAQESFMLLDAKVRARFSNDPQEFLEFCTTPGNEAELKRLGLFKETDNVDDKGKSAGSGAPPGGAAGASGGGS